MIKNSRVVVTGGEGFLGGYVVDRLRNCGFTDIYIPSHSEFDLRIHKNCDRALLGARYCIHLAANVGGIGLNQAKPAELFYDNIMMGANIIKSAACFGLDKILVVGTICAYPKFTQVPFKEEDLWLGYPEETNAPYGIAKKSLLVYLQACRSQYGLNGIFLLPVNLYGPKDCFSPESSHVIPALIKKFYDAIIKDEKIVEVWGTGKATREFLYVDDCAEGIVKAFLNYNKPHPVNLGAGFEISIKDLVDIIVLKMGYTGTIVWNSSKPDGQPRRTLDISKAREEFGFVAKTSFSVGINKTIDWYIKERLGKL